MKIKDLYLGYLSESDNNFFYLNEGTVGEVTNVVPNKELEFIRIDFTTTYGKKMSVVSDYNKFMAWYKENKSKNYRPGQLFKKYVEKFVSISNETEPINEIIDDNGDIMPSTDLPSNATNRMVGDKMKWDLEKVYRSSIPKGIRFYSGDLGIGIITW